MSDGSSPSFLCATCSHANPVGPDDGEGFRCRRCGETHRRPRPRSLEMTLAFSLSALILYLPANFFPFMTIELYGRTNSATILGGVRALFEDGAWGLALVVFLASVVIPLLKLVVLFYISLTAKGGRAPRLKTKLYKIVESIGRWSMLDIFLLAVLVAIMKLGPWTRVTPGTGSALFLLVVILTMLASASFDPRLLWENTDEDI